MPKYTAKLVVPAETTSRDPVTEDLKVSQGRIAQVSVTWTPGSQWLNCFIAKYEGAQIIPSEGSGQCRGDGVPDTWPENIVLDKSHPVLNLEAWNEGNTYEHDCLVSIIMLPVEPDPFKLIRDFLEVIKKLIGL